MRLIPIGLCKPGMKLGRKIINEDGVVLLAENAELTGTIILKLEQHGISNLYIADPRTEDIRIAESISEESRRRAIHEIRTHFRRLMVDSAPRRAVNAPFFGKAFKMVVSMLADDLRQNSEAMIMLTEMSVTDHYLYSHSLNVCVFALLLGIAQDYGQEELTALGLGALLHDIGKTKIPLSCFIRKALLQRKNRSCYAVTRILAIDCLRMSPISHCCLLIAPSSIMKG